MRNVFLIMIFCLQSVNLWSLCLDNKIDAKVVKVIREQSKIILDSKNEKVVPLGLPEGKFPVRSIDFIQTIRGNALVFFTFKETKEDLGFMAPYSFKAKTKTLEKIVVSDLGNGDARFWDIKTKILSKCKNSQIKITYDSCSECSAGNDLTGHFTFNEDTLSWNFLKDQ